MLICMRPPDFCRQGPPRRRPSQLRSARFQRLDARRVGAPCPGRPEPQVNRAPRRPPTPTEQEACTSVRGQARARRAPTVSGPSPAPGITVIRPAARAKTLSSASSPSGAVRAPARGQDAVEPQLHRLIHRAFQIVAQIKGAVQRQPHPLRRPHQRAQRGQVQRRAMGGAQHHPRQPRAARCGRDVVPASPPPRPPKRRNRPPAAGSSQKPARHSPPPAASARPKASAPPATAPSKARSGRPRR
jgi:hypothetical protein